MTAIAVPLPAAEAVATMRAAVDGLLAADFTGYEAAEFLALVDDLEVDARRWAAVDARVLAEMKDRYLAGQLGRTSVADVLRARLHVAPAEARARQLRAEHLGPRRQITGEVLPPLVEDTAAALEAGEISGAHATVITRALGRLPESVGEAVPDIVQFHLLSAARRTDPATLRQMADQLLAHVLPEREPRTERRGITLSPRVGGLRAIRGEVTDELAALLEVVFDALAAPHPAVELADGTVQRDGRTAANRRHDAVLEVFKRVLRSGTVPDSGGVPATLIITAGLDELARRGATVRTSHGELITLDQALAMAGDLTVDLCLTDDTDEATEASAPATTDQRPPTRPMQPTSTIELALSTAARCADCSPACSRASPVRGSCWPGAVFAATRPARNARSWPAATGRMLLPRLHPPAGLDPGPPHRALGGRRPHRRRQHVPGLRVPSPTARPRRLERPHGRRRPPRMDPTRPARSGATAFAQSCASPTRRPVPTGARPVDLTCRWLAPQSSGSNPCARNSRS